MTSGRAVDGYVADGFSSSYQNQITGCYLRPVAPDSELQSGRFDGILATGTIVGDRLTGDSRPHEALVIDCRSLE
ncbi:hypothetical protein [Natrinema halophilum]|uniref:Uncharacterized protein n=1 Tax=Natrinema halophilum TaxID=1699371 RepID=A0A7D5KF46_9EURY|nr:hypothetical protein [Natrinema halophilum]QLG50836.1 hypothetical protein HYG82_19345 [Natrinema halophilum]